MNLSPSAKCQIANAYGPFTLQSLGNLFHKRSRLIAKLAEASHQFYGSTISHQVTLKPIRLSKKSLTSHAVIENSSKNAQRRLSIKNAFHIKHSCASGAGTECEHKILELQITLAGCLWAGNDRNRFFELSWFQFLAKFAHGLI